jgi:hypothetical protein
MRVLPTGMLLLCLLVPGCCYFETREEPPYPTDVTGWKQSREGGILSLGKFVLKEGETTDNGQVQVKVIRLYDGDMCSEAGTLGRLPKAAFQFTSLPDQKVLCKAAFNAGGASSISSVCGDGLDQFGISSIAVGGVNTKDKWVSFALFR